MTKKQEDIFPFGKALGDARDAKVLFCQGSSPNFASKIKRT